MITFKYKDVFNLVDILVKWEKRKFCRLNFSRKLDI